MIIMTVIMASEDGHGHPGLLEVPQPGRVAGGRVLVAGQALERHRQHHRQQGHHHDHLHRGDPGLVPAQAPTDAHGSTRVMLGIEGDTGSTRVAGELTDPEPPVAVTVQVP
jgi:hypothetical protein